MLEDDRFGETMMVQHEWQTWTKTLNAGIVGVATLAVLAKLTLVGGGAHHGTHDVAHLAASAKSMASDVWSSYEHVLAESPIRTKAVTSATVYTIGDVIAQRTEGAEELDSWRVGRSLVAGLIGHGPMSHFYYNLSESFFNDVLHLTAWWSFVPKIVVDQAMFAPIWNNSYILLLGLMKMDSLESIVEDMKEKTVPLIVEGLKLWPLVHCVTYGLIPVENRLLWVDLVEILWVTILASKAAEQSKPAALAPEGTR